METKTVGLIVLILIIILCCIGVCCVGFAGITLFGVSEAGGLTNEFSDGFEQGYSSVYTEPEPLIESTDIIGEDVPQEAYDELARQASTVTSRNDAREIAERLLGLEDIPEVLSVSAAPVSIGEQSNFWVIDGDTDENFEIQATMEYATPHVYFWVENGVNFKQNELEKLTNTFEEHIYPTNHEFFGTEWTPGIDGDEHIYILYSRGIGSNTAGYFSSNDSVHPLAASYSNGHEMFLMNADVVTLRDEYIYGVLAHEFQHMIHWNLDSNEESWVNEGFSELASLLNGYDPGGFDTLYFVNTDVQLNEWPNDPDKTSVHYGSSFLFITYFLDRFGEELTKQVIRSEANGFDSIDNALLEDNTMDGITGESVLADDVFVDWSITNYLQDKNIEDGRYDYYSYDPTMRSSTTSFDSECTSDWKASSVRQYGVDLIELECSGQKILEFDGANLVKLIPSDANSGKYSFWSNQGDDSDMHLTQKFDLTNVSEPVEMTYFTWYDLEEDYDYVYVLTSSDGEDWEFVQTDLGTDYDPVGNNLGWAYNGTTEWIQERIDLSAYAGQEVYVRFEYITDAAVNGEGFLIDDVEIPAIGYSEDFESGDGGWVADGFIRTQNNLPQSFRVTIFEDAANPDIRKYTLAAGDSLTIDLDFDQQETIYMLVSGTTRYTRQPALYQYRFNSK
ncbi:MAG: immune inhibitor A [Anaerolineaceae bacterium]|nr:immune inhibitor A [Anaerolineaceae bacterium]